METPKQMTPEEMDKLANKQKPEENEEENCCCAPMLIAAVLAIALAITGYFLYLSYDDNEAIKKELQDVRELYYERPESVTILNPEMVGKCFAEEGDVAYYQVIGLSDYGYEVATISPKDDLITKKRRWVLEDYKSAKELTGSEFNCKELK